MSYASLFENIIERLEAALGDMAVKRQRRKSTTNERATLREAAKRAQNLLFELSSALEIATDPTVNMAAEVKRLRSENSLLQGKVSAAERRAADFQMRLLKTNGQVKELQGHVQKLESQFKRLEAQHEKVLKRCPAAIYDEYSSPGRIAKYKPTL